MPGNNGDSTPGSLVGAQGQNLPGSSIYTKDGTPNFTALSTMPTPGSGQVNIWQVPTYVLKYEKDFPQPFWWGTDSVGNSRFTNPQFEQANGYAGPQIHAVNGEDLMKNVMALAWNNPAAFGDIQALLKKYWDKNLPLTGKWNDATGAALGKAMTQYLQATQAGIAVPFLKYLQGGGAPTDANGNPLPGDMESASGRGKKPPVFPLENPDNLQAAVQQAAMTALGHSLSAQEVQRFIDTFHNQQKQAYMQAADTSAQGGGFVDSGPTAGSMGIEAMNFVKQQDPTGVAEHQTHGYANALLNLLLSGSPAVSNLNNDVNTVAASG